MGEMSAIVWILFMLHSSFSELQIQAGIKFDLQQQAGRSERVDYTDKIEEIRTSDGDV